MKIFSYNTELHIDNISLNSLLVRMCKNAYKKACKKAFGSVFEFFSAFVKTDNYEICALPVFNEDYYR